MVLNSLPPLRAPHRAFFLLGTGMLLLSLGGWLAQIVHPRAVTAPPGWLHGWLMSFGVFGPFISGFLFTAYSRWLAARPPSETCWLTSLVLQFFGLALLILGEGGANACTVAASGLLLGGWALVLGHLLTALFRGQGVVLHAWTMLLAVGAGSVALLLMLAWAVSGETRWALASLATTQWGFLLVVYLVVAHRMVPFFAGCVLKPYEPYRPAWALIACLLLANAHLGLVLAGELRWLWCVDLSLLGLCTWLAIRWQAWRARENHLLFSLFLAWIALLFGLALLAAQSAWLWFDGSLLGGRGPAHVVAIGFFGAMLVAMGTRVTLGHSGRPLVMDRVAWACLWGVLLAAATRGMAEMSAAPRTLTFVSATIWLLAAGAWSIRYAPMLWRPRVDSAKG